MDVKLVNGSIPKIDKNIPTPLYYQLIQFLKQQIESGLLKPGDIIPTEKKLCEECGISRSTVRQALLQLVNEGYLRREKSKGSYVTEPPLKLCFLEGLQGFSAEMNRLDIPYYTKVLAKKIVMPSKKIAAKLEIDLDCAVFYVKRLRFVNKIPYLIDEHFIPYELCAGIEKMDLEKVSLYSTLENEYGLDLYRGWREFESILPVSKEEIELLNIFPSANLLYVESVVYNRNGKPMDYFELKVHGRFTENIINKKPISRMLVISINRTN